MEMLKEFMTLGHMPDLKKILESAKFPVYILQNPSLGYSFTGINFGYSHSSIEAVSLGFMRPEASLPLEASSPGQQITIGSFRQDRWHGLGVMFFVELYNHGYDVDRLQLPADFAGIWSESPEALNNFTKFIEQVPWGTYAAPLIPVELYSWSSPTPISLAYSADERIRMGVTAVGTSYSEFILVLDSLALLQQSDETLISELQLQMKTTRDEQNRRRKAQS